MSGSITHHYSMHDQVGVMGGRGKGKPGDSDQRHLYTPMILTWPY